MSDDDDTGNPLQPTAEPSDAVPDRTVSEDAQSGGAASDNTGRGGTEFGGARPGSTAPGDAGLTGTPLGSTEFASTALGSTAPGDPHAGAPHTTNPFTGPQTTDPAGPPQTDDPTPSPDTTDRFTGPRTSGPFTDPHTTTGPQSPPPPSAPPPPFSPPPSSSTPPPSSPPPPPSSSQRSPLRRERRSRMIAGVCGGLGRHLDIDPIVFRIMFVVLTFFGGLGLLVYAALWLFVPVDGGRQSEAQRLLTGRSALGAIAITVVLVLGFMAMVSTVSDGFGRAVPLLVVAAAIVAVLVWRNENRASTAPDQGRAEFADAEFGARSWGADGDPQQPKPWWQRPVSGYPAPSADTGPIPGAEYSAGIGQTPPPYGEATESRGSADRGGVGATSHGDGTHGRAESAYGTTYAGDRTDAGQGESGSSRGRRLSGLALSGSLVILGILGILAAAGVIRIGWSTGTALAIMAIGAGMAIGGLYGRTRWLIPVGLVLAIPLIVGNALGVPLRGDTGRVDWAPGSVAAATASTYELAGGQGSLDLTAVNPAGGIVHVTAHVGAGKLLVTVPNDVEVQLTAHVGIGQIQFVDGMTTGGLDVTKSLDSGAIGTSRGTIALDLKVGAGDVEVDRVTG